MRIEAFIIDPQVSFCDPAVGELYVNGAEQDMWRLAAFVRRVPQKLDAIHVTLDSHNPFDIAHPLYWKDARGNRPAPFTIISAGDVENGVWMPVRPGLFEYSLEYVTKLEAGGRYPLCIWPPHCLIGSVGQTVIEPLAAALKEWAEARVGLVDFVTKGSNPLTEHYSAIRAEVPDANDPSTQLNTRLIQSLMKADLIVLAGEAGSHCLANTVRDLVGEFGDDSYVRKLVLLEDCTSPVPGFEKYQDDFIADMTARGMKLARSTDFLL